MAFFEWDPELSVNIAEIDQQHKKLIGLINRLNEAMQPGNRDMFKSAMKELITQASVINEMVDYSQYHFSTEEGYMRRYEYPDYEKHKTEHEFFTQEVRIFKKDFDNGKVVLSNKIMQFLKEWLGNHIRGTDKKYEPFFRERRLSGEVLQG
jgi:hemerythrin